MAKEKPNYYSIIPANVRYDDELKANEKLLYGEITALANKNGYCWAENSYFAELYNVHKKTVSSWIGNLEKRGYIKIELQYIKGSKQVAKRKIFIQGTPGNQKAPTPPRKDGEGTHEKTDPPIHEKTEEELNTTSTNTTSINKDSRNSDKPKYDDTSRYVEIAKRHYEHIKKRNPKQKEPNWQKWADDYRKTIELDKRDFKEAVLVLDWCQRNEFWQNNILSPAKFRKQYDQLFLKMDSEQQKTQGKDWENWDFFA